jgi:hypothetical protein
MVIKNIPRQDSFSVDQEGKEWDPCTLLEIINPDRGTFTCVGYAPSKRRRCQNPIAAHNRDSVYKTLDVLASTSPNSSTVASLLPRIAALSLCRRYHQTQSASVVEQWRSKIHALKPLRNRRNSATSSSSPAPPETPEGKSGARTSASQARAREEQRRREREELERQQQERLEKEQRDRIREERERKARNERERRAREQTEKEKREWDQAWKDYLTRWVAFKGRPFKSLLSVLLLIFFYQRPKSSP